MNEADSGMASRPMDAACTILVVDDSRSMRVSLKILLQEEPAFASILEAADGLEAFRVLKTRKVDLVLCDLYMPGTDGLKFIHLVRTHFVDLPIVLITGHESAELPLDVAATLLKPVDTAVLFQTVWAHLPKRVGTMRFTQSAK